MFYNTTKNGNTWNVESKGSGDFIHLEVGKKYLSMQGAVDGVKMDMDDCGMIARVSLQAPTKSEICQFQTDKPFEMRLVQIKGIIFGLFKFGNMNWMDAPYTVHLSRNLTKFPLVPDGMGILLHVMLFDGMTGKLCKMRAITLSTEISREFVRLAMEQRGNPFTAAKYYKDVLSVYELYTTSELAKMAKCKFELCCQ